MNPIYFSIIIATITLIAMVFAIFGAAWLNGRNTERIIDSLKSEMRSENEAIRNELRTEIRRLDQRIDSVEQRLDRIERQIEQRFDRIERQLEAIFKPILPK
jgi:uncharacterized protein YlxW (UPF0749 family)